MGVAAAEQIVYLFCNMDSDLTYKPRYGRECRDDATDACQEHLLDKVEYYCPDKGVSYADLWTMDNNCKGVQIMR